MRPPPADAHDLGPTTDAPQNLPTPLARREAAAAFVERWRGHGYEKGETQAFWIDLLSSVVGLPHASTAARFEQQTSFGGFIDVLIPEAKTLIEQKSSHVNLDHEELRQGTQVTPFQQAKRYADALPNPQRPDFIIVCNFQTFRIHDLRRESPALTYLSFELEELAEHPHLLDFLIDPALSRSERERKVSIQAGQAIAALRDSLHEGYLAAGEDRWQDLNILCVRLVFCLYAEDAGLFPKDGFGTYLRGFSASQMRQALLDLFSVLNTPDDERSPYLPDSLRAFPYVNGGLFAQDIEIPQLSEETRTLLVEEVSSQVDWSGISPTVFGGVFESTLNPETRRSGGMHYTSPENIHRVIDPLFLDGLTRELEGILADVSLTPLRRRNRLTRYQDKLASLVFFDPAAGSGNFLTETYIHLRRLENRVLQELMGNQTSFEFEGVGESAIKVHLGQFVGIEINDFAVSVARTALWIAQLQANAETAQIVRREVEDLPLRDAARIVHGNALRLDWNEVVPASECSYVFGNPPFIGYLRLSKEQQEDRALLFPRIKTIDYVGCWYKKAADYMAGTQIEAAFVSTNSICQGLQVKPLWEPLFEIGLGITFAYRSFMWGNEASDQAHVHVIIVGFSYRERSPRLLFDVNQNGSLEMQEVGHINGYLVDAPDIFIDKRRKPLCDVPPMVFGNTPIDGGHLLLSRAERDELIHTERQAAKWIRPFSMGFEFINGKERYCLWLKDCPPHLLLTMPHVRERIEQVRDMRLSSSRSATRLRAEDPWLFGEIRYEDGPYIAVPAVSSERRRYVPMGFVTNGMIPGNKLFFVPNGNLFVFGVLMSRVHNAWTHTVAGRLKSDFNYANTIVYNNLVWPEPSSEQRTEIETAAQAVLDARALYPTATLADMYDPDHALFYPDLMRAHARLDRAVEAAYGWHFPADMPDSEIEQEIVSHLFTLYAQATA